MAFFLHAKKANRVTNPREVIYRCLIALSLIVTDLTGRSGTRSRQELNGAYPRKTVVAKEISLGGAPSGGPAWIAALRPSAGSPSPVVTAPAGLPSSL